MARRGRAEERGGNGRSRRAGPGDGAARGARGGDPLVRLALAVALVALGITAWLLGEDRLSAPLRLSGGALIGLGAGVLVLAVLGRSLARRPRALRIATSAVALLTALALTIPAVAVHRAGTLGGPVLEGLEPLAADDRVVSVPGTQAPSPILVLRVSGTAQLIAADGSRADDLGAVSGDAVALTPDARAVLVVHDGTTRRAPATDPRAWTELEGEAIAAPEGLLVLRSCDETTCTDRAVPADDPAAEPLWSIDAGPGAPGPDAEGARLPGPGAATGALAAVRDAGIVPSAAVRWTEGQGWFSVDPRTGFVHGRRIAGSEEPCRVVAPSSRTVLDEVSPVMAVCTAEDGAVTVRAHRDGSPLWESAPTAPGAWRATVSGGRTVLEGRPADGSAGGLLVISEASAAATAPGGPEADGAYRALVGVDGRDVVRITDDGRAVDHDLVTGELVWSAPVVGEEVRGALGGRTTVLLDDRPREDALDPAGARRLRVVDDATGRVTVDRWSTDPPRDVRPVSAGRALVQTDDGLLLVGP